MSQISLLIMPLCESHSDCCGHSRSWEDVLCDLPAEIEETDEHQAYSIAWSDFSMLIIEINTWFDLRITHDQWQTVEWLWILWSWSYDGHKANILYNSELALDEGVHITTLQRNYVAWMSLANTLLWKKYLMVNTQNERKEF
jgi:hypothetical protein